ncbi:putative clathrin assembly protein At1g25240 [Pistacia vera]|uniref:putative clathrin assembly protein At1g25240 n=1 Tax=Pistacia vera TaxID=55513 RepID=UPI0012635BF7|nr:putative clathrin assembly protein At1g25240 [Pistacia vera]
MSLWKRAAGLLKDRNSIWAASFCRKSSYRNPDLEAAIIKATSHDELHVDYRNAQRVFVRLRNSPLSVKPLVWALSKRMEKTKSWVVALKGLILMHGVFCCKIPAVQRIGRLPFDLSSFSDGHSRTSNSWGFNNFIRAYYAFLDQRSAFFYEQSKPSEEPMMQELNKLQSLQDLLDLLLQIKPLGKNMRVTLILEAMDCVVIEIYDVYSRICNGIARVLMRIYSAGQGEVALALKVLLKATEQGDELSLYFEFCRDFGILNTLELPKVTQVPEEDIRVLERLINGVPENNDKGDLKKKEDSEMADLDDDDVEEKAMVMKENESCVDNQEQKLRTIITDEWEVFDEDLKVNEEENVAERSSNPFIDSPNVLPFVPEHKHDLPDLIGFY